jgi:hypothetical protein
LWASSVGEYRNGGVHFFHLLNSCGCWLFSWRWAFLLCGCVKCQRVCSISPWIWKPWVATALSPVYWFRFPCLFITLRPIQKNTINEIVYLTITTQKSTFLFTASYLEGRTGERPETLLSF